MSLNAEHLADLKKSALTDDTIAKAGVYSVRPSELKQFPTVNSGLAFPYPDTNGVINGFCRIKLFPPSKSKEGKEIRYYQEAGTEPRIYWPPLCDWVALLADPSRRLTLTEGEKKALALSQYGIQCLGLGGLWNFLTKVDGLKFILPALELLDWKKRPVELAPDSDVWRREDLLRAVAVLGLVLSRRGAQVAVVRIPEQAGSVKVGADDFLVSESAWPKEAWEGLERVPLTDTVFKKAMAWAGDWIDKQITLKAIKHQDAELLDLQEVAGRFTVHSSTHHVTFVFDRLNDARGSVYAELSVVLGATELLSGVDIGLKSDDKQTKLAAGLKKVAATVPWKLLLGKACSLVLQRHRAGTPVTLLDPADPHVPFLLNPIVYRQHPTLIYAPGGSLKSYLALYFGLVVAHGRTQANVAGVKSSVLYLDWELNAETVGGRLKALQAGHPELSHVRPYYRRCEYPLAQEVHQIAAEVAKLNIGFVIADSAAMACGGELSAPEAAITLQRAFRHIGCASLTLAHVAKHTPDGQQKSAYGTVFFRELSRNTWELEKAEQENPALLVLKQDKNNFGPKHAPLGFSVTFGDGSARVEACDPADEPALETALPLPNRTRNLLDDGMPRTAKEIAEELGVPLGTVKTTLSRYKGKKWHRIGEYHDGQWTVLNR